MNRTDGTSAETTIRVAIYARVSTKQQEYEMQLTELRAYALRAGWDVVEYTEKASSVKHRPEFERMMEDARLRKFQIVLVWKVDRFGRSLQDFLRNVLLLDSFGVRFIAATQAIDTDKRDPMAKFVLGLFGLLAEFERGMIVERTRAAVAEAQRQGKHCGRPRRVFRRDDVVRLRDVDGLSWRAIATRLDVPVMTVVDAYRECTESPADAASDVPHKTKRSSGTA
jgi:DNA invertase Pin-like site-specific DNA recombinase